GEAQRALHEPRPEARPSTPASRSAEASPRPRHHGCAHPGGPRAPPTARSRDLPDPPLHRDAARLGRDVARAEHRSRVAYPQRARQGRQDARIPLPAAVTQYLQSFVDQVVSKEAGTITADTPIFWSTWGQARPGKGSPPDDREE